MSVCTRLSQALLTSHVTPANSKHCRWPRSCCLHPQWSHATAGAWQETSCWCSKSWACWCTPTPPTRLWPTCSQTPFEMTLRPASTTPCSVRAPCRVMSYRAALRSYPHQSLLLLLCVCADRHTSEHSMLEHTHRKFCGAPSPPPVPPRAPSGATSVSNGAGLIPASPLVVPMRARGPSDASVDSTDAAAALSSWHMEPGAGLAAQGLAAAVGRGGGLGGAQILAPSSVIAWLQASGAGSTATAAARRHRASSGGDSSAATTESDMVSDVSAAVRSYCVRACADVLWCGVVMLLLALPFPSAWREAAIKQQRSR